MNAGTPQLAAVLLALLVSTAGCGDIAAPDELPTTAPSTTRSTPTSTPPRTSTPPSEADQKIRVVGEITSTGDCVAVRDANEITWTLTGDKTSDLKVGDRVQATGIPDLTRTGCAGPLVRVSAIAITITLVD